MATIDENREAAEIKTPYRTNGRQLAEEARAQPMNLETWIDVLLAVTRESCLRWQCLPTEIWAGCRSSAARKLKRERRRRADGLKRERNVSAARREVAFYLRGHIGSLGSYNARGNRRQGYEYFPDGLPPTHFPLSMSDAGRLLGVDHSALLRAMRTEDCHGETTLTSVAGEHQRLAQGPPIESRDGVQAGAQALERGS